MGKIKILGRIIDKDGRRPDPEGAVVIKDIPAPDNFSSLQSFLGLASYYKIFISIMYDLCSPLNELLKRQALGFSPLNARKYLKK